MTSLPQQSKPTIDAEFQAIIPSPLAEEKEQLEANLKRDGCLEPLTVWKDHDIILDGYSRYEICERLNIPYRVNYVDLSDRLAAKVWIIQHQLGRRNLTDYQRTELALKLKPLIAAKANQSKAGRALPSTLTEAVDTRTELAKIAGVSTGTMHK